MVQALFTTISTNDVKLLPQLSFFLRKLMGFCWYSKSSKSILILGSPTDTTVIWLITEFITINKIFGSGLFTRSHSGVLLRQNFSVKNLHGIYILRKTKYIVFN